MLDKLQKQECRIISSTLLASLCLRCYIGKCSSELVELVFLVDGQSCQIVRENLLKYFARDHAKQVLLLTGAILEKQPVKFSKISYHNR